jgi:PadR family transcriptional regulator AphA
MVLDHAILGLLSRQPLTGYALKKVFDNSIRHFWTADQSHIYRVLGRLSAQGFVTFQSVPQQGKPHRKIYTITSEGREELVRWLASDEARSVTVREPFLVRLFFASLLPNEQVLERLREDAAREGCLLSEYEKMSERSLELVAGNPSRERFFWYLTLDYGLWMTRACLEWLNVTIDRIARGDPDSDSWGKTFPSMPDPKKHLRPPSEADRSEPNQASTAAGICEVSKTTAVTREGGGPA